MASEDSLSCQEVVELVTGYLENTLISDMYERFEQHIADCPGCTNYVQQVRLTIDMLHQLAQEPAFPRTKQELLRFFRNWKKG